MSSPQDIFTQAVDSILSNVHTCMPGIIVSYNESNSTAQVQPALNKNYYSGEIAMPIVENVPVVFPSSSSFSMSFPLSAGDTVLLVMCERSIDLWKSVGGQLTPDDRRKFALSDAVAIPGLQPLNADFSLREEGAFALSYAGSSIVIRQNGDVEIKSSSTIAIGTSVTELLDVISQTLALLSSATAVPAVPSGGSPPQPLTFSATAASLQSQIDAIKGIIS